VARVQYIALFAREHRNDSAFAVMPSESCYVTLIENAILLCVAYALLDFYFEDVMRYGFLFFAVFIGLCTCYASTALAFCIMLLDDTTSTQMLLLDAERPFETPPPNNIAHAARTLARAATACSVALLLLFLTVACEFFTEDSAPDSLPAIALKAKAVEDVLTTQFAVSTALVVYFMLVLMLLGSNQQLNGIFLRLQYMTQKVPLEPAEAAAYATRADDVALFVRALLGLCVVMCGSTGTFQEIPLLSRSEAFKTAIGGAQRNYVALCFISWCCVTDALRALPVAASTESFVLVALALLDMLHVTVSVLLAFVLFRDSSLTNFACAVLVICDAACVLYTSFWRVLDKVYPVWTTVGQLLERKAFNFPLPAPNQMSQVQVGEQPKSEKLGSDGTSADLHKAMSVGAGLCFSEAHFNVDNIKMRVFEKKSN
jgi:hypothetical protein